MRSINKWTSLSIGRKVWTFCISKDLAQRMGKTFPSLRKHSVSRQKATKLKLCTPQKAQKRCKAANSR